MNCGKSYIIFITLIRSNDHMVGNNVIIPYPIRFIKSGLPCIGMTPTIWSYAIEVINND